MIAEDPEALAAARRTRLRLTLELALVFAVAFWARRPLLDLPAGPQEAFHFAAARELGRANPDLLPVIGNIDIFFRLSLWSRPLFYGGLHPLAEWSWEATRVFVVACASLLPVLAVLLLRTWNVSWMFRLPAALVIAVHPLFSLWGSLVTPAGIATLPLAASLLASRRGAPWAAGAWLLAALAIDRIALLPGLVLLASVLHRSVRETGGRWWPLRADATASVYALALSAGPLALSYSGAQVLGLDGAAQTLGIVSRSFVALWLAPLVLGALFAKEARTVALVAVAQILLFLTAYFTIERTANETQFVVGGFFAVLAATLALHAWRAPRPGLRPLVGVVVALVLLAPAVVPTDGLARSLVAPGQPAQYYDGPTARGDLADLAREADDISARLRAGPWTQSLLMDVDLRQLHEPFLYATPGRIAWHVSSFYPGNTSAWPKLVEAPGRATVVQRNDAPLNEATRATYADCAVLSTTWYILLDGPACAGRADRFLADYEARRTAT